MLSIHIWLLLVRLRAEEKEGKQLAQALYENFTEDVELRVRAEGVKVSRSTCPLSPFRCAFSNLAIIRDCTCRTLLYLLRVTRHAMLDKS